MDKEYGRHPGVGRLYRPTPPLAADPPQFQRGLPIDRAYVSRVFKLTRVSPAIVDQAHAGKVTMEALITMGDCWVRQEA